MIKQPFTVIRSTAFMRFRRCAVAASLIVGCWSTVAICDQYTDYGIQLFNQHRYEEARKYFNQSLKLSPKGDHSHYYRALCCEHLNDPGAAVADYEFVVSNCTNPKLVALAKSSLDRLSSQIKSKEDAGGFSSSSTRTVASMSPDSSSSSSSSRAGSDDGSKTSSRGSKSRKADRQSLVAEMARVTHDPTDVVPEESRVYFTQSGNDDVYIDTQVNGRDFKMILDTGAYSTMIGKNQLEQLKLPLPSGPPTSDVGGVGGTRLPAWIMPVQITVGKIKRTVQCSIPEVWEGQPLLGQDFYHDLEYEFDNKGHCIYFRKSKVLSATEKNMYCIPFTRWGRHLVVQVEVDGGYHTGMFVDTGATGIAMTMANARDLHIDIPADAQKVRSVGVGGTADAFTFPIEKLRLGPIIQRSPQISITTSEDGMLGTLHGKYGLLGQAFFGNWRFTIDNANNLIRFFH